MARESLRQRKHLNASTARAEIPVCRRFSCADSRLRRTRAVAFYLACRLSAFSNG